MIWIQDFFTSGTWIVSGIPDSLCCIPDSIAQDSGFRNSNFPDFGIRNPDSFLRDDNIMTSGKCYLTHILNQLKPLKVMLHGLRFATTIFTATQRCNVNNVGTML